MAPDMLELAEHILDSKAGDFDPADCSTGPCGMSSTRCLPGASMLLRVLADETIAVRHPHLRQRLLVHRVVLADELVERKDVCGQRVGFVIGERLRLRPWHRPAREVE